jgi:hypothetical protein
LKHIWNLFAKSRSLWVAWVKVTLLKASGRFTGSSFCSKVQEKREQPPPNGCFYKSKVTGC